MKRILSVLLLLSALAQAAGCFYYGPKDPPIEGDDVSIDIGDDAD